MFPQKHRLLLAVGFLSAACTQPTIALPTEPGKFTPTTGASAEILPSATAVPAAIPSLPADRGCQETAGEMFEAELNNPELSRSLPYRIYVPPCAEEAHRELPTLYLLHGLARTDAQWDEIGVDEVAQDLLEDGRAPPFLIVMPLERLGLEYEKTIVEYLIPHIESEYGASPNRELRSIGGISRGAGWALRIGLQHPDLFTAIGLHSPAVLAPDIFVIPDWIEAIPAEAMPDFWIDIGDRDSLRFALPELTGLFNAADVSYVFRSYPGEHIEAYWADHVEDYVRWYVSGWLDLKIGDQPQ